jgi:hypothetical protein
VTCPPCAAPPLLLLLLLLTLPDAAERRIASSRACCCCSSRVCGNLHGTPPAMPPLLATCRSAVVAERASQPALDDSQFENCATPVACRLRASGLLPRFSTWRRLSVLALRLLASLLLLLLAECRPWGPGRAGCM